MDRPIVYTVEVPRSADFLGLAKDALYGIGNLVDAAIGPQTSPGTWVSGLGISPTGPASLSVIIGRGSIYTDATVDTNAYSTLGTDANSVGKQGIVKTPTTLTITPPGTSGFSQVYLVQVAYQDVDTAAIVPPYFNSTNPGIPFSGAGGGGGSQNTQRNGVCVIALKAGTAAPTGSQTAPAPDAGFIGLYAITVVNGQTTITSSNWYTLAGAPFIIPLTQIQQLFQRVITVPTTYNVNNAIGNDSTGDGSVNFPWRSIAFALSVISTYNLNGNTITIQLANTGIAYTPPTTGSAFILPVSGPVVIQGNGASQSSYVISGSPTSAGSVISLLSGTLYLTGLTVKNIFALAATNCITAYSGSSIYLQNVTLTNTGGTITSMTTASGGVITFLAGCIITGVATQCFLPQYAGSVIMGANIAFTGTNTYTNTILATSVGLFYLAAPGGWSFSGTVTATNRYVVILNAVVNTNGGGTGFFPGTNIVAPTTGGQYA